MADWPTDNKTLLVAQGSDCDDSAASGDDTTDVTMSLRLPSQNWKAMAVRDVITHVTVTSDVVNHMDMLMLDRRVPKEHQTTPGQTEKKKTVRFKEGKTTTAGSRQASGLSGYVNALFRCDDDDSNDLSTLRALRVTCVQDIGGRGSGEGELEDGTDLLLTGEGSLIVTDLINSRLQKFDSESGDVTMVIQSDEIVEPWASALTPKGGLAVTSRKNGRVVVLDSQGRVTGRFGESRLSCPAGIAVTDDGHYVVADFQTSKVYVFSSDGTFIKQLIPAAGVTFHQPRHVTVSRCHGDVIVSDSGNHRLVLFDKEGNFLRTIGSFGKGDGCLKFPHATVADRLGNIFVCDRYNDRVSAFTRSGDFVRHLVTSSSHRLRHPQGLALTLRGDSDLLYVSHGGLKAHSVAVLSLSLAPRL